MGTVAASTRLLGVGLLAVTVACSGSQADEADPPAPPASTVAERAPVVFPGASFATGDPEALDLSPAALRRLDRYYATTGANCVAVVRDGVLVHERYWNGYDAETDQEVFSATKSITATLVGIAQDAGLLDIDDPASDYIPEWRGTPSEPVTIRNLLSNDSGRHYDFGTDYVDMAIGARDKTAVSIGLDQQHEPGTEWDYNNAAIQTLEAVLEAATGQDVARYAEEHLFEPIGMSAEINHDPAGNTLTFMGARASCQDLARFGLLALSDGEWDGEQVVSAEYMQEATAPSQDLNTVYGFLWWLNSDGRRLDDPAQGASTVIDDGTWSWPDAPPDTFAAQGLGGQLAVVVPSEGLVVARLGPGPGGASVNEIVRILLEA
jgi:CubicO group peptidase (beta-lactamase class C family)